MGRGRREGRGAGLSNADPTGEAGGTLAPGPNGGAACERGGAGLETRRGCALFSAFLSLALCQCEKWKRKEIDSLKSATLSC